MRRSLVLVALLAVSFGACTSAQAPEKPQPLLQTEDTLDILAVVPDMSGSFTSIMSEHGWPFMTTLLRNFKRDLAGEDKTRIVIGQISGVPQGPIFDGSLRSFGKKMGGASDFHGFIRSHANLGGSRVFDSIRETVEYATQFVGPDTRAGVFILSDMDNTIGAPDAEEKLVQAFAAWGKKGGSVGMYWVDLDKVAKWRENLRRAGVKNFVVESKIAADPTFPSYER